MSDMTVLDYAMMVEDTHVNTQIIEYRKRGPDSFIDPKGDGELVAVALTDVMADGCRWSIHFSRRICMSAHSAPI
jgi:arginine-tRNA-protein transferase